ncbi:hypothetical protein F441_13309 [Phytophthora nicotianae CJ01A1]|uniref:BZIP domain-containing protein n=1 Tax=Phytophthora nicotianae CJ01A1 TaxID=1317063 RepID=W2WKZ4_PHYNI|nr:hypothetical protein F441_13309 [Phytophthora nicotianae CJ01A1]
MEGEKSVDAFLDEVATFLDQTDAPEGARNHSHEAATTSVDDSLLLASHQLLAETEDLLASHKNSDCYQRQQDVRSASTNAKSSEDDRSESQCTDELSAEKRREIRNALAAQRRVRYRQKLKDEKEVLKQQATELSAQLTSLETSQAERKAKHASNLMFGAWRAVAARQLERRMQAEQQQKLLRAEVVGRSRLIHQMSLLLDEPLKINEQDPPISYAKYCENGVSALHKNMLEELDAAYLRIDDVMRDLDFKSVVSAAYNYSRKQKDGVVYFDNVDRIVFPYKFEQAADGLETVMMSDPDGGYETAKLKDAIAMNYRVTYQISEAETVSFNIHGAAKRWRQKDRLVFLWRCFTEGLDEFEGLQSDETAWIVVRPPTEKTDVNCDQSCSTIIDSYSRLVPVGIGLSPVCDGAVDRFVNILSKSGEVEFKQMMQMMEKVIINDP